MKKLLYVLIIPLLFITRVHALDNVYVSDFYNSFEFYSSIDSTIIDNLITYYNNNFSSSYNYYFITSDDNNNTIVLRATNLNNVYFDGNYFHLNNGNAGSGISYKYSFITNTYSEDGFASIWGKILYSTNIDFIFNDSSTCDHYQPTQNCYDSLTIPSYSNLNLDVSIPQIDISSGDTIPTYMSLTNGTLQADFTTVDLSQYEYIILSLRNYDTEPFNTTIYTQGSLCFTPVYNYGMQQKNEVILGTQVQGCTEAYSSLTPVPIYIIESDITNHSVYYIKQQEDISTTLKIPTSIFDITYISSSETDPQVLIGGRSYPVIPYNDLTDTANISTDNGYISGQVCSLGDVNCQAPQNGMDISDLFTHPLELLKSLWSSITNVFLLITTFIGLLPTTLQAFLYTAFMLAIVLGIIKIIL